MQIIIRDYSYTYTTYDIRDFIKESTTLEQLDFLRKNIEKSNIDKDNKDILLTMTYLKYLSFPLSEEEELTKTEISRRTKICPHCKEMFREDKESHFKEKNHKPRRIHECCIKDYVRQKYNVKQSNLYDFINDNYEFVEVNKNN